MLRKIFYEPNLDLLSSSSKNLRALSRIRPMVPNTGKVEVRSGTLMPKKNVASLTINPKSSNNITEGILVIDAVRSNT
jgi:hypothetical protein